MTRVVGLSPTLIYGVSCRRGVSQRSTTAESAIGLLAYSFSSERDLGFWKLHAKVEGRMVGDCDSGTAVCTDLTGMDKNER